MHIVVGIGVVVDVVTGQLHAAAKRHLLSRHCFASAVVNVALASTASLIVVEVKQLRSK